MQFIYRSIPISPHKQTYKQ